ncbi:MAG: NUDIX hydrolase [Candidatus Paceibacterota bacterium]
MKQTIYTLIMPVVKLYWRIFKPQSYGVKVVIVHPHDQNKVLLVRHSYGNTTLWNIPGGGFNPKKETAYSAILREVQEELGIDVFNLRELEEYHTGGEGKKDTVTLFSGIIKNPENIKINPEISALAWVEMSILRDRGDDVARVARRAVEKILTSNV